MTASDHADPSGDVADRPLLLAVDRATAIAQRTLEAFPVRVWRHFLRHNGFLLAASLSYQSLFAVFAVLYALFAVVGVWLGGSEEAIERVIALVNSMIPNLISEHGLATPEAVTEIAQRGAGVLAVTGAVAFGIAAWTAIGFVTFARRAVRDIFGLPFDGRNFLILKARDLLAGLLFGLALVLGSALGAVAIGALRSILHAIGAPDLSTWTYILSQALSLLVSFAINGAALALLVRFLTGTRLPWRIILPGAMLGGAALAVLQVGAGLLFLYSPTNPLLATFSVVIGFLLWFRLVGIVILVASAWIAVSAADRDQPLIVEDAESARLRELRAVAVAAGVRLRGAQADLDDAPWYARWRARRALRAAQDEKDAADAALAAETARPRR